MVPSREKELKTIVVDLTPILPGGENGGAKVFVLELLRRLAERATQTNFILLTQSRSHEELAALDAANMRRLMVLDVDAPRSFASRLAHKLNKALPQSVKFQLKRIAAKIKPLVAKQPSSLLRTLNADLLFCPFTALTHLDADIPTVSVIYDFQDRTYPHFFTPIEILQRNRTFDDASRRSTVLIAISEYSRVSAIKYGNLATDRVKTIMLQIPQHSLVNAPRDEAVLGRLALSPQRYLIYPANFWKHKNHEALLAAFAIASRTGLAQDVQLVFTGAPGPRRDILEETARNAGLDSRIRFTGYVAPSELLALMLNSAGMIFPSLYEGFGLPVIEAMAAGVPVACSSVTALPEVAGDAAILFNPAVHEQIAEAMIALVNDKKLTARLILAGRKRAAVFSDSGRMADQYREAFTLAATIHRGNFS